MIVQKYGGTSVATIDKIWKIAKVIEQTLKTEEKMIVVLSAMSGETDSLSALAQDGFGVTNGREFDQLVCLGENKTVALMALALKKLGVKAKSLTGWQAGIVTDEQFSLAKISEIKIQKLNEYLKNNDVILVTGFQGVTVGGDITTLGKGGSDTTAIALAAAMGCECQIFTDVCGVFAADPNKIKKPKKIDRLGYDEFMEMAASGAKVMEVRSTVIAKRYGVRFWVSESLKKKENGTVVCEEREKFEGAIVKNVTMKQDVVLVRAFVRGCEINCVLEALEEQGIPLNGFVVRSCEDGDEETRCAEVEFCVENNRVEFVKEKLETVKTDQELYEDGLAQISVIGSGFRTYEGVVSKVRDVAEKLSVKIKRMQVEQMVLSLWVKACNAQKMAEALCKKFDLCEE